MKPGVALSLLYGLISSPAPESSSVLLHTGAEPLLMVAAAPVLTSVSLHVVSSVYSVSLLVSGHFSELKMNGLTSYLGFGEMQNCKIP